MESIENLFFVQQFLDSEKILKIRKLESDWTSEIEVHYNSRVEQLLKLQEKEMIAQRIIDSPDQTELYFTTEKETGRQIAHYRLISEEESHIEWRESTNSLDDTKLSLLSNLYFEYRVEPKIFEELSAKERLFFYEVMRLYSIRYRSFAWILDDYTQLLDKRGFRNNPRYFYLRSLTDNQFVYELDVKLTKGSRERRYYYRILNGFFGRNNLTFEEVLKRFFFHPLSEREKRKSKRLVRHKGYRDHGSLGSEISKTLKDQSSDWSIRESELQRQKAQQDFIDFAQAFQGWM